MNKEKLKNIANKKKIKETLKKENWIYVFFSMYFIAIIMNETVLTLISINFKQVVIAMRLVSLVYFILKRCVDWKNGTTITLGEIVAVFISMIVYLFSNTKDLLFLVIILIALRNENKEKLIKLILKVTVITFSIIIIGAMLDIIPDWTWPRNGILRHGLGFVWVTNPIGFYLFIIMMYTYVRKSKITIYEIAFLEMLNVFFYKYTDGRTSFILITVILFVVLLTKIKKLKNIINKKLSQKILKSICYTAPITLLLVAIISTFLYRYNNSTMHSLNIILSDRIRLTDKAFEDYDVTLFGQNIKWQGWGGFGYIEQSEQENFVYNYVDNSYARIILDYGMIPTTIIIIGYTIILIKSYNKKEYWMIFEVFIILLLSEIEPCLSTINRNIFLISFVSLLEYGKIEKFQYNNVLYNIKKLIKK